MLVEVIIAVCAVGTLLLEVADFFESKKNNR